MSKTKYVALSFLFSLILIPSAHRLELTKGNSAPIVVPYDFTTIQEAINNATDGATVLVLAGTYYEHIVVNKTLSLIGENCATTVVDGNETGVVINVTRNNVTISGLTVQRSGSAYWQDGGIILDNVWNCRIMTNIITGNPFAGIYLYNSSECEVIENQITENAGVGITTGYGGGSHIISMNNITRNGWSAITLNEADNNAIQWNNMTANNLAVDDDIDLCVNLYRSNNNSVIGNNIKDDDNGIRLEYWSRYNRVVENNITQITTAGIAIETNSDNNTVSCNTITSCKFGIVVNGSRYDDIYNNTIAHNHGSGWGTGIRLDSAGYTLIHDNQITDNWRAIHLITSSPNVSIYRNNVTNNEFGIRVLGGGSNYLNVSENYIANNYGGYGVGVTGIGGESSYAIISGNVIVNNIDGVALGQGSNHNTVFQNNISQNEYGIGMENSTQNLIYSNNIIDNIYQVSITSGSINTWDNGYPSGCNCWSDYVSPDMFSGPYQNVTGGDGIGDNPYVIDANNRDNYPFMLVSVCNVSQVPESGMISPSDEVEINATITHLYPLERAMLNYTVVNNTGTFHFSLNMTNVDGDVWNATIPAFPAGTNVTYVVIGRDSEGNTVNSEQQGYTLEYHVIPEFSLILILPLLSTMVLIVTVIAKQSILPASFNRRRVLFS